MPKAAIVADEDNVLLISWEEARLLGRGDVVFAVGAKHVIPDRHEEGIVGLVVLVMADVEFRSVEEIAEGRKRKI